MGSWCSGFALGVEGFLIGCGVRALPGLLAAACIAVAAAVAAVAAAAVAAAAMPSGGGRRV